MNLASDTSDQSSENPVRNDVRENVPGTITENSPESSPVVTQENKPEVTQVSAPDTESDTKSDTEPDTAFDPEIAPDTAPDNRAGLLNTYLASHDTPCPRCGYNLRKLQGSTCPECGSELTLRVGLADPHFASYLTLLIALSTGAGCGFFILIMAMIGSPPNSWWFSLSAIGIFSQLIICTIGLIICIKCRVAVLKKSKEFQWGLAIGAITLVLTLSTLFFVYLD